MKNILRTVIITLVILIAGFAGMKILAAMKKPQPKTTRQPQVRSVQVQVAEFTPQRPEIKALGRVRSEHPVQLAAEVPGTIQPTAFEFKSGARFKKGDVLVRIDPRRAELAFKSAVSALLNGLAAFLPEVKLDIPDVFEKWQKFFSEVGFAPLPELPDVNDQKEKLYLSRFNIYNLYFTARSQQIVLEKHTLKAPFSGTVLKANFRPGSMAGAGMALGTLLRTDKLEVEFPVPIADAGWIDKREKARLKISETGIETAGDIDRISQAMEGAQQTVMVYVTLKQKAGKNGPELMDGMFAEAVFMGHKIPRAVMIPRKAVIRQENLYLVRDSRLAEQKVAIARLGLEKAYVTDGIQEGDTLVTESLQDAILGMLVKPVR